MGNRNDPLSSALLTPGQASQLLGIHPNTLRRWSDLGVVPAYRVGPGGHRRFRRRDLLAYLDEMTEDIRKRDSSEGIRHVPSRTAAKRSRTPARV